MKIKLTEDEKAKIDKLLETLRYGHDLFIMLIESYCTNALEKLAKKKEIDLDTGNWIYDDKEGFFEMKEEKKDEQLKLPLNE